MPQTLLWWCTQSYLQWGHLQLPLVTAFLYSGIRLDASGYLLIPISFVLRYGTLHKMSLKTCTLINRPAHLDAFILILQAC